MKILLKIIVVCNLMISGCFTTSSKEKKDDNPEQLKTLWQYAYDLDGGAPRVQPLIFKNNIITSGDINVTALNFSTGELVWKTSFNHHRQLLNRYFGLYDNVITGSIVDGIIAWNVDTGETLWQITIPDSLSFNNSRSIGVIPEGFVAASNDSFLYQINIEGELDLNILDARSYETTYYNGALYIGQVKDMKGIVSAYDASTFELLWRFEPGSFDYPAYTAPKIENNIVYIGTTAGPDGHKQGFFALDANTGEEIWRREGIWTYSAVLSDDKIFGVNGDGVWALSKETGQVLWKTKSQGGHSESNLDYLDGYVYWAHGGGLHIFDADTGELVKVEPSPDGSYLWQVTAGEGRIFVQSNRSLFAFAPWGHEEAIE